VAEQLQLLITVDDQGSAVVQQFAGSLRQVTETDLLTTEKNAGKAAAGFDKIGQSVSQISQKLPVFSAALTITRQAISQFDKPLIGIDKIGQSVTVATNVLPAFQQKIFTTADALKQLEKHSSATAIGFMQLEKSMAQTGSKGLSPALTKSLQELEGGLRKTEAAAGTTTKAVDGMALPLGGLLKQGAAIGAGMLGFQGVASVVTGTVSAMAGFEAQMNTVNTLVQGNVPLQQQLRAELLQLPPVLGSSAQLAEGLYAALSAGIEPTKAVAFVGEAAKAAKAGLTDMETSVNTLTSVMKAYGIESQDVTKVSDILFQTVNLGKGKFADFARAFATVSPLASTLGISLKETAATLATLSFAFPSAAEGATGYRSVLANLIQNMGDFRSAGIDAMKVIGEEGFTGLLKRMKEATGDNIEAIRKLIPDVEGLSASLALGGKAAAEQGKNLLEMDNAIGKTQGAFQEMSKGAKAAWDELLATLDRLGQEVAPPLLAALTSMTQGLTGLVAQTRLFKDLRFSLVLEDLVTALQAADQKLKDAETNAGGFTLTFQGVLAALGDAAKGFVGLETALGATIRKQIEATTAWNDFGDTLQHRVTPAAQAFNMEIARAKDIAAANEQAAIAAVTNMQQAFAAANANLNADTGHTVKTLTLIWEDGQAKIVESYSQIPSELQPTQEQLKAQADQTVTAVVETWQQMHAGIMASYEGVMQEILALNEMTGQGIRQAAEQSTASMQSTAAAAVAAAQTVEAVFIPLLNRIAQFKGFSTPFATTEAEIVEQIRGFQENINKLREPGMHQTIPGYVEFQIGEYNKAIQELYKRLAELHAQNEAAQRQADQGLGLGLGTTRIVTSRSSSVQETGGGQWPYGYNIPGGGSTGGGAPGTPNTPIDFGYGLPGRAMGGPVRKGQPYWVGEKGTPEVFVPQEDGMVMPQRGMRQSVTINVTVNGATDARATVRALLPALREAFRREEFVR
jgi:TP901 family phage tail tape measure protein